MMRECTPKLSGPAVRATAETLRRRGNRGKGVSCSLRCSSPNGELESLAVLLQT